MKNKVNLKVKTAGFSLKTIYLKTFYRMKNKVNKLEVVDSRIVH